MESLFGDLEIRNDPWNVEYGSEIPAIAGEQEESIKTPPVLDVEVAAEEWRPLRPVSAPAPTQMAFVDGVRRVEHRVVLGRGGVRHHGAFGSFAVGAVTVSDNRARFTEYQPERILAAAADALPEEGERLRINPGLCYRYVATKANEGLIGSGAMRGVDAPMRAIHDQMRNAEEALGRRLAESRNDLVIMDGPLTFESSSRGWAVGYIKRITYFYIPDTLHGILAALPPQARTPIFALEGSKRFARYSWFVRLDSPRRGDSEFSGIVRMEVCKGDISKDDVIRLADMCTVHVPRFASRRGLDPRAPQNLVPVGALETHMRRRLGDVQLINRYIRAFVARSETT